MQRTRYKNILAFFYVKLKFKARFKVDTLHGTVTRKHRQRVATLKKWRYPCRKNRRHFAAVFACRDVSRTLSFWEVPNPHQRRGGNRKYF